MSVRTGVNEYNQTTSDISSGYVGEFKYFGFETVPPHCLACDGSEVSRETYSELFAVFGETFGAGDGATTFNLPDFRGAFLRCVGGNAAALGVKQGDAIRKMTGLIKVNVTGGGGGTDSLVHSTVNGGDADAGVFGVSTPQDLNDYENWAPLTAAIVTGRYGWGQHVTFDAARVAPTAAEVRPINCAVNICVVYE